MHVEQLTRRFVYNGINLTDPGSTLTPDAVKDFYGATYPELVNAEIQGPKRSGAVDVYTFHKAVGTKGARQKASPDLEQCLVDIAARRERIESGPDVITSPITTPISRACRQLLVDTFDGACSAPLFAPSAALAVLP